MVKTMNLNLSQAEYADQILTHYITMVLRDCGRNVDSDVLAELDGLIKSAITQAVNEAVRQALSAVPSSMLE